MPSSATPVLGALAAAAALSGPAAALAGAADLAPPTVSSVVVEGQNTPAAEPLSTRSLDAETIARTVNATTVEDVLKYQPAILARRRHIGDTQAPITTRTSGVGASARSLIYADGVLLSALIGNNNSTASPRWSMVAPAEVERVDLRYGPFSAAYPGNSVGAVVEITTRTPRVLEAEAQATAAWQSFSLYGAGATYPTYAGSASLGDRRGPFWWRLSFSHLDSESQPLSYMTMTTASAARTPSPAATPVAGAAPTLNRNGAPILVLGAGGLEHQRQDGGKLKLGWDITPALTATYLLGYFGQTDDAHVESYLRDAAGGPVYAGLVNIGGATYNIPQSAFASGLYEFTERHWMQALTLAGQPTTTFSWKAVATLYDYGKDEQRTPAGLPSGFAGGPGSILDMSGTGWRTLDLDAAWQAAPAHLLRGGLHHDRYELASNRFATADWRTGPKGALAAASLGKTETDAAWLEDTVGLSPRLRLTLGARLERWRAFDGVNYSASPALDVRQPERSATRTSPKAVLAYARGDWQVTASAGLAYRFPTVTELYQVVTTGPSPFVPDPNLKPERAVSSELSVERSFARGRARLSLFTEDLADAMISQTATASNVSFVQNVDKVRSRGAELELEGRDMLLPGLDLSASATYVESEIAEDRALPAAEGKRTPQVPRLRWTAVAFWRANERLTLATAARYSDRVWGTIDNSDVFGHTYQGFEGYFVVDARATYRLTDRWSAAVGVDNLGDRRYFLFHPFPGRTVLAEVRYEFGDRR